MSRKPVQFRLNGAEKAVFVDDGQNLLDVLRRGIGDFAPKYGCGQGTCGVCTVLIDNEPHLACLTLAETCDGREVQTASGLARGPELHPLQNAFMEHFAAQCGFCTPGMIIAAEAMLERRPAGAVPSRDEIRYELVGNLCRCTGYTKILDAIEEHARRRAAT